MKMSAENIDFSGVRLGVSSGPTPPSSENGGDDAECGGCGFPASATIGVEINTPPSPPASIKGRRNRASQQREANRSKQFTSRLQRSVTTTEKPSDSVLLGRRRGQGFRRQTTSLPIDHGLKAVEPPHDQPLTKMAFAEQQKWITVQQKTFTKWYASST